MTAPPPSTQIELIDRALALLPNEASWCPWQERIRDTFGVVTQRCLVGALQDANGGRDDGLCGEVAATISLRFLDNVHPAVFNDRASYDGVIEVLRKVRTYYADLQGADSRLLEHAGPDGERLTATS